MFFTPNALQVAQRDIGGNQLPKSVSNAQGL